MDNIDSNNEASKPKSEEQQTTKTEQPLINIQDNYAEPVEDEDDFVEIPDMEDFDDQNNVVAPTQTQSNENNDNNDNNNNQDKDKEEEKTMFKVSEKGDNEIIKTRTYDVSITYDKYYRVPRVWLRGYDENGNPLTSQQIFEDISADHAHKTVTVEPHIHTGVVCASIHPCRHSEVMKRFMTKFEESGKSITVDQYLFLFLKFMSAVIPTIQYDFTQSVDSK